MNLGRLFYGSGLHSYRCIRGHRFGTFTPPCKEGNQPSTCRKRRGSSGQPGSGTWRTDVSRRRHHLRQVESCVKQAFEVYGQVNWIAYCVGSLLLKPAHILPEEEWDATITTNLKSAFAVVRAATTAMAQQGGSIVLLSTAAARIGLAKHEAISVAKAGSMDWRPPPRRVMSRRESGSTVSPQARPARL